MIGYFPTPHPDELLYSVCARFQERVRYHSKMTLNRELFGHAYMSAKIDLPTGLDHLTGSFPTKDHTLSTSRLIDGHTLLPFYSVFLPRERVSRVREFMRSVTTRDSSGISAMCGITNSNISPPGNLRFCPTCASEDRKSFRETYWHRVHQVPGVEVCPTHAVFLEDADVRARYRDDRFGYMAAEQAVRTVPTRPLDLSDGDHVVLLAVACASFRLLKGECSSFTPEWIRDRYVHLLSAKGLAVMTGSVRARELLKEMKRYYSNELLRTLQCDFEESSTNSWPALIVRSMKGCHVQHPLRHILLILFLGQTVETFFRAASEYKPFGDGPWPCLNPACDYSYEPAIEQFLLVHRRVSARGTLPVATFACPCGFEYERIGPDKTLEDRRRHSRVLSYGPVWEAKLKEFWDDPSLSIPMMMSRLGVATRTTVKREAMRLGLRFPRKGPSNQSVQKLESPKRRISSGTSFTGKRSAYRKEWEGVLRKNPNLSRWHLQRRFTGLHWWLKRYDGDWLNAHLPPSKKGGGVTRRADWRGRDATLSAAVRASAIRLRQQPGRPVQVTRNRIGRDICQSSTLEKHLAKLPRTKQALAEVAETRVQFAVRRVEWAADSFRKEKVCPSRYMLLRRACFGSDLWDEPEVAEAADGALHSLSPRADFAQIALAS